MKQRDTQVAFRVPDAMLAGMKHRAVVEAQRRGEPVTISEYLRALITRDIESGATA